MALRGTAANEPVDDDAAIYLARERTHTVTLLSHHALQTFDRREFSNNRPFPWYCFSRLLRDEAFSALHTEFPSLELFEKHAGIERVHGQRPHNRYYLAFGQSIYGKRQSGEPGSVGLEHLTPTWRDFIRQLQSDETYLAFVRELLGVERLAMRFAWHVAGPGDDVSPHVDAREKAGTHFFYFNTSADWKSEWGGETMFLGGKRTERLNPEIADFAERHVAPIVDNRSALFRNTQNAWHAVDVLRCPEGRHRRLFNVIFEHAAARASRRPSFLRRMSRRLLNRGLPEHHAARAAAADYGSSPRW